MAKYKYLLALQAFIFLIPLNVYMWGDWLLVNVQWALVRYQQSPIGSSIILCYKDIFYILEGRTTGIYNILAASSWTLGSVLLLTGILITLCAWIYERSGLLRTASLFVIGGGIMYCFSALGRFTGGFSIPIGVPIIFITGWLLYHQKPGPEDDEEMSDEENPEDTE
ncbi:MAG: hypothetical protein OS112_06855 [Methanoregula sp.]|nr:MAG: hypothetical protein OS112_06855 [Methanoregula sp.]